MTKSTPLLLALATSFLHLTALAQPNLPAKQGQASPSPSTAKPNPAKSNSPTSPAAQPSIVEDPILVKGEGLQIRRSDFELEKKSVPPEQRVQLSINMERIQRTLERMMLNRALLDELNQSGFANDPFVQAELDYARNQKLVSLYLAKLTGDIPLPDFEPAMRERYKLQSAQITEPEKVRASHILITTKTRNKEEARARAETVRAKALAGEKFENLVKEYSEDPSARRNDGDLGFFPYAQMVPAFSKAAFAMNKEGEISSVVETEFGYHVIRYAGRKAQRTPTYEEVKATYLEELTRDYQSQQLRSKLDEIVVKKKPQVNMDEVNKLIDNSVARAAAEFNAKIRAEIEEEQRKKHEESQRK